MDSLGLCNAYATATKGKGLTSTRANLRRGRHSGCITLNKDTTMLLSIQSAAAMEKHVCPNHLSRSCTGFFKCEESVVKHITDLGAICTTGCIPPIASPSGIGPHCCRRFCSWNRRHEVLCLLLDVLAIDVCDSWSRSRNP